MSLAEMRAHARAHDLPVDIERQDIGGGSEMIRLRSAVNGDCLMADIVCPAGEADRALDDLAARFLFWWRQGGA